MVRELFRRGKSAVLSYVSITASGASSSIHLAGAQVRCVLSDDITRDQLPEFFRRLAKLAEKRQVAKLGIPVENEADLFEFKGDHLGLSLDEFRARHHKPAQAGRRQLPWCSDETASVPVPQLRSMSWHADAGIVHARVDDPAIDTPVTIAGVATDLVLYRFIDGRLFQIVAEFGTEGFHLVHGALQRKYGESVSETGSPRKLQWWTLASSMELSFGRLTPREPARLVISHDSLQRLAGQREPSSEADL